MFSTIAIITGIANGILSAVSSIFSFMRDMLIYNAGRKAAAEEIMEGENKIDAKQDDIMVQNRTKEDIENRLGKGDF